MSKCHVCLEVQFGQGYGSVDESRTPSTRSDLVSSVAGSGSSARDLKVYHDLGVDMDLMDRICKAAAFTVLNQLQSSYEKEKLLDMLVNVVAKEGPCWSSNLR